MRSRLAAAGSVLAVVLLAACSSSSETSTTTSSAASATSVVATATTTAQASTLPATGAAGFAALNPATGYGLLRVMTLEERPDPRDVVVYEALPNELPRIAGVITTVEQTPLSHVNLRAVQDKVPNAYVADALDRPEVKALVGRWVKYTVTADGFTVEQATQAQVDEFYAASRPSAPQTPERNLAITSITPLSAVRFEDWTAFGVKAANVATLARIGLTQAEVPDGFAVPFAFYDEFMKANGFYDRVKALLADPEFQRDADVQDEQLKELRDDIEDAPMPDALMTALGTMQASFPAGMSLRCRSSTNNEDLPNFNGAGLYDSKTQHPDEGHVSKCIKQVYASVWNLRAYLERDFYRIDHLATAMGVLVIPAFEDEKVNGVAVTIDPVYDTPNAYYVNSQLGEDLVTNPDALSVPEALILGPDDFVGVASRSNLAEPGELLMADAQLAALRSSLATVHTEFAELYGARDGEKFAMEIEFKITTTGALAIKQARRWVFN